MIGRPTSEGMLYLFSAGRFFHGLGLSAVRSVVCTEELFPAWSYLFIFTSIKTMNTSSIIVSAFGQTIAQIHQTCSIIVNIFSEQPEVVSPTDGSATPDLEEPTLEFHELLRCIRYNGTYHLFKPRKSRRYEFLRYLWERVGQFVSAEELASELFDHAITKQWPTIRRYGQRVQRYEVGPKNFPFYIQQEAEGFRLILLS